MPFDSQASQVLLKSLDIFVLRGLVEDAERISSRLVNRGSDNPQGALMHLLLPLLDQDPIPSVPASRPREGRRRMGIGASGVQRQAVVGPENGVKPRQTALRRAEMSFRWRFGRN